MYDETFNDGTTYTRLETQDWNELKGKRVNGHGKITGLTNADGELHPAVLRIEGGEDITVDDLPYVEFDGRHNFINA